MAVLTDPRFPHLRRHISLYNSIGIDGMSSEDEIELPGQTPRKRGTWRKQYLSMEVSTLGHHLDSLSHRYIKPMTYERIATGRVRRASRAVCGLAWNVYDGKWRTALLPSEREALRAGKTRYDFSLDYR